MGKNTASSYRKVKKMEKSKVKMKTSKTLLPKGQNVTDTNFRVKKIVIKDQARQHSEEEILSKDKLSCKELIGRLTHHNIRIRLDSLNSLKQLVTAHPEEVLQQNLAPLIESLSKLILDESKDVRKEVNKLFTVVLSMGSLKKLTPLYQFMNSYLICGLTHIMTTVREDALETLDILLKLTPQLVSKYIHQFLPICLDLLSNRTSNSRVLILNLDSKLTSSRWRRKVLKRISVLLSVLMESQTDLKKNKCSTLPQKPLLEVVYKNIPVENEMRYVPINLLPIKYNTIILNDIFSRETKNAENWNLKDFIKELTPILFEAFIEEVPFEEGLTEKTSTVISAETSIFLKHIVEIIYYSWELISTVEEEWFRSNFGKSFMKSLITGRFPYTLSSDDLLRKKKEKCGMVNSDLSPNCQFQNLMLIRFVLLLVEPPLWTDAISCLKNYIRMSDILSPQEISVLFFCSKRVICCCKRNASSFLRNLNKLSRSPDKNLSTLAIYSLYEIAVDPKFSSLLEDQAFQSWFDYLPKIITKPYLTAKTLDVICDLARRNIPAFSVALDGYIEYILDKIPEISLNDCEDNEVRIKIARLLFWVKDWDDEMITNLRKGLDNKYWGDSITGCLEDVFNMKFRSTSPDNK